MAGIASAIILAGCADVNTSPQTATPATPKSAQTQTVKIGFVGPLSGPAAAVGEQMKKVLDYALPTVNKKYLDKGYQFELIYEDGKCSGGDSATAFQKLTDVDGVKFIIGGACSSESLGFAPLLVDKKVVAVSALSSSPDLEGKSPNLFSLSYSDDGNAKVMADQLGKYSKIAMINEQNDYNEAIRKNVEKNLKEKYPSATIVDNEKFPKGSTDFRNILAKIKAAKPDVLFINSNVGTTSEALIKQLAEIKDWNVEKVAGINMMGDNVLKIAPQTLEGTIIVDAPKINTAEFLDLMNKIIAEKGKLDDIGNYYVAATLDDLNIMAQVISENNNNVPAVQGALSTQTFSGYLGNNLMFGGKTFVQGIGVAKFVIKDGKVVPM